MELTFLDYLGNLEEFTLLPIGIEVFFVHFEVLLARLLLYLLGYHDTFRSSSFLRFSIILSLQGSHSNLLLKGFLIRFNQFIDTKFLSSCY